jgi:antirestriction protein ArdC
MEVLMNTYEIVTNRILSVMEQGEIPWRKPWKSLRPQNLNGRFYTGINRVLLSVSGFSDSRYLTMNQANKLGAKVKKGSKGNVVVFWKFTPVEEELSDGKIVTSTVPFMRLYSVFNVSQCEGLDIPASIDTEPIKSAQEVIDSWAGSPKVEFGGNRAAYSPSIDKVYMPLLAQFDSANEYYSIFYHELGHSTGHPSRLHRFEEKEFDEVAYGKEELVAEFTAAFLCSSAGIDTDGLVENTSAYLNNWKRVISADSRLIVSAAGKAQKAVDMILGISAEVELAA